MLDEEKRVTISFFPGPKKYKARLKFGEETDTLDCTGKVTRVVSADHIFREDIERISTNFVGRIKQVPPAYSAVHVGGKRSYELARKGVAVELPSREVDIYQLQCLSWDFPVAEFVIKCSAGTYIRRLLSDIAISLSSVGHLISLERMQQGPYTIEDAVELSYLNSTERILEVIDKFARAHQLRDARFLGA
eukprot:jgi/Galph1/1768/GphlegSOOS_G457.1